MAPRGATRVAPASEHSPTQGEPRPQGWVMLRIGYVIGRERAFWPLRELSEAASLRVGYRDVNPGAPQPAFPPRGSTSAAGSAREAAGSKLDRTRPEGTDAYCGVAVRRAGRG